MANTAAEFPDLWVHDLLALNDIELGQFLVKLRRSVKENAPYKIPLTIYLQGVAFPLNDDQKRIIQMLKDQKASVKTAADLSQVSARLQDWLEGNTSPTFPRPNWDFKSGPQTLPNVVFPGLPREIDILADRLLGEAKAFHAQLVKESGRPWYSISFLDNLSENPANHREIPSSRDPPKPFRWRVFEEQWEKWQEFRLWQKNNRKVPEDEAETAADSTLEAFRGETTQHGGAETIRGLGYESAIARAKSLWARRKEREPRQEIRDDHPDGDFPEYVKAVKRRLAHHGFQSTGAVQLDEDPTRQNKLTTWIEFVSFEAWQMDQCSAHVESLQPLYDEGKKMLEDSQLPRPDELEELLRNGDKTDKCEKEQAAARNAVEKALSNIKSTVEKTKKDKDVSQAPRFTPKQRMQMMAESRSQYDAAKSALDLSEKRGPLISDFLRKRKDYYYRGKRGTGVMTELSRPGSHVVANWPKTDNGPQSCWD